MSQEEELFNRHIDGASFQAGVDQGMWGLYEPPTWPFVILWVKAASKTGFPDKYYFRFDLSGYPSVAPTAKLWNKDSGAALSKNEWPSGGAVTNSVFNKNWGKDSLYIACDRTAMEGHAAWPREYPDLWWKATDRIDKYLNALYKRLNSKDYGGN
ncbi:MAG: hypothetical protein ACLQQ4_07390 [Bacteroidia bacterium]